MTSSVGIVVGVAALKAVHLPGHSEAEGCLSGFFENVLVRNYSVHVEGRIAANDASLLSCIDQLWIRERHHLKSHVGLKYGNARLTNIAYISSGKCASCWNVLRRNSREDLTGRSFPSINDQDSVMISTSNRRNDGLNWPNPSSLIQSRLFDAGIQKSLGLGSAEAGIFFCNVVCSLRGTSLPGGDINGVPRNVELEVGNKKSTQGSDYQPYRQTRYHYIGARLKCLRVGLLTMEFKQKIIVIFSTLVLLGLLTSRFLFRVWNENRRVSWPNIVGLIVCVIFAHLIAYGFAAWVTTIYKEKEFVTS